MCWILVFHVCFFLQGCAQDMAAAEVHLSPGSWPSGEYEELERLNLVKKDRPKPLAMSSGKGIVSGTTNAFAVHSGMDALRQGGNAMDACLTTALAEVALASGSYVSYGGVTNIVYYDKTSDQVFSLDGGWNVPEHLNPSSISPQHSVEPNGNTVLVPGFIAGVADAADKFAKFPLSTLLEPAIYFTEKGFKLPYWLYGAIYSNWNPTTLLRTPEGRKIFTNPATGMQYKYKELFKQPEMAAFLKNVSVKGKSYVYKDMFARDLAAYVQANKGTITTEDMANYQATWNTPVSTTYSGHQIYSSGAEWGGAELSQKLNLMELAGLGDSTDTYLTNSTKLFWLASISRLSFFLSWYSKIVPNGPEILHREFGVDMSTAARQTKANAEALWEKMGSPQKMAQANAIIKKLLGGGMDRREVKEEDHLFGSDGVVSIDSEGNACAMIHTINSNLWGTGLFVQGTALNRAGAVFKSYVKVSKPGGRLPSALQPAIALKAALNAASTEKDKGEERLADIELVDTLQLKDYKKIRSDDENERRPAVLAVSVVGQSYSMATPQFITGILDSHMTPKEALDSPTILLPSSGTYYQDVRMEEFAMDKHVLNGTRDLGQAITLVDFAAFNGALGLGVIATVDEDGTMYAGCNSARWGLAEGV